MIRWMNDGSWEESKLTELLMSVGENPLKIVNNLPVQTICVSDLCWSSGQPCFSLLPSPFLRPLLCGKDIHLEAREPDTASVHLPCRIQGPGNDYNTEGSVGVIKIEILGFMVVLCNHAKLPSLYGKVSQTCTKLLAPKHHSFSLQSKKEQL